MGECGDGEGLLWSAVADAVATVAHLEPEWDDRKLEKKVREHFKKAAKNLAFTSKSWDVLINEYADNVFSALFSAIGDREWLRGGQVDFLFCVDAGVKDHFPRHLIASLPQPLFERTVFSAHDRAFEEQRCLPQLWEVTQSIISKAKARKRVYNAVEAGRKEALARRGGLEDFAGGWIDSAVRHLAQENHGALGSVLDEPTAIRLFHALIDGGALPSVLIEVAGQPPPSWPFVGEAVRKSYAARAPGANGYHAGFAGRGMKGGCQGYTVNGFPQLNHPASAWGEAWPPLAKRFKGGEAAGSFAAA